MHPEMVSSVLTGSLALARDSWRGQLVVLAFSSLVTGAVVDGISGGDALLRTALAATFMVAGVAASVRAAAARDEEPCWSAVADELVALAALAPRVVAQAGLAAAPLLVAAIVALQLGSMVPLLGVLLVPVVFVVALLVAPGVLLAIVAVVLGDRTWLPTAAARALRRSPGTLVLTTVVGGVVASFATVPLMLTGVVLGSLVGPFGALGFGLAMAVLVPAAGCGALAMWTASGASLHAPGSGFAPPSAVADRDEVAGDSVVGWADGPAWHIALEPGSVWGTWVRLEAPANLAFRLEWSGATAPTLALAGGDGTWRTPGSAARSGDAVRAALPAGDTYVQVGCRDAAAQAVSVTMLVPMGAAA